MLDRFLTPQITAKKSSVLLLGPRQVGKSTLARSLSPALTISLSNQSTMIEMKKDPGQLLREIAFLKKPSLVVLDEIQRVPELLNTVQYLIDEHPVKHRFLITGSSARKLKRGEANLLPGRIMKATLTPLLWKELKEEFDLKRALVVGMLPGIFLNKDEGSDLLGTYVEVYLREEIQAEALTKNLGNFARLLDVIALSSGQWLNYAKLSSDAEINKETIRSYIAILEETLLLYRIPAFTPKKHVSRRVSQRDKILLFDIGVRNSLLGIHTRSLPPQDKGPAFEQWCILQSIYMNETLKKGWLISSFLDYGHYEVDLVIDTGRKVFGIEIKSGSSYRADWSKGISALSKYLGKGKLEKRIWFQGSRPQRLEDGTILLNYLEGLEELLAE